MRYFRREEQKRLKQKFSIVTSEEPGWNSNNISHFEFCQKGKFQWMKISMAENPQRFPAFDPCESAMEPGGQITCWIGFSEVLVLASGGRSSDPAWPADKGRALTTIGMGGFFSPPMESPALNRVCIAELSSTPILRVRTPWGQSSA